MDLADRRNVTVRILDWLRAGYPEGIPRQDYEPLLGLLRRQLTPEDIESIAADLVSQSRAIDEPVSEDDIRRMIEQTVIQHASEVDIARVSAHLAAGGWPLEADIA